MSSSESGSASIATMARSAPSMIPKWLPASEISSRSASSSALACPRGGRSRAATARAVARFRLTLSLVNAYSVTRSASWEVAMVSQLKAVAHSLAARTDSLRTSG